MGLMVQSTDAIELSGHHEPRAVSRTAFLGARNKFCGHTTVQTHFARMVIVSVYYYQLWTRALKKCT